MSSRRRWRRLALRFLLILMLLAVALPTAAWLTLHGQPVCWLCTLPIALRTAAGPHAQPTRQPVIA